MINWLTGDNRSTYYIFTLTFITCLGTMVYSVLNEMGPTELELVNNLLEKDGAQAYALVGVVIAFTLLFMLIQIFFSSVFLHIIAKFIFRLPISFKSFHRVYLIFLIIISLSIFWQVLFYNNQYEIFLLATNPLVLIGMLVLFLLLRGVVNINQVKPLLFTLFCYVNFIIFTSLSLGGN